MRYLLSGAQVYRKGGFKKQDLLIADGRIVAICPPVSSLPADTTVIDMANLFLFPGFVDVHVHLREPGFSYKETVATGTAAAARGGVTSVCTMPNLDPAPDSAEHLAVQQAIIDRDAVVHTYPLGTLTVGRAGKVIAPFAEMPGAIAFSDDGSGVQDDDLMRAAMTEVKRLGKIVAAHCEVNDLIRAGISTTANMPPPTGIGASAPRASGDRSSVILSWYARRGSSTTSATFRPPRASS